MRFLSFVFFFLFFFNLFNYSQAFAEDREKINLAVFGFNFSDNDNLNFSPEKSIKDSLEKILLNDSYFSLIETINETKDFITPEMLVDFCNKSEADAVITGTISKYNEAFWLNLKLVDTIQARTLYSQDFFSSPDKFEKISIEYIENLKKLFKQNPNLRNIYQITRGQSRIKA